MTLEEPKKRRIWPLHGGWERFPWGSGTWTVILRLTWHVWNRKRSKECPSVCKGPACIPLIFPCCAFRGALDRNQEGHGVGLRQSTPGFKSSKSTETCRELLATVGLRIRSGAKRIGMARERWQTEMLQRSSASPCHYSQWTFFSPRLKEHVNVRDWKKVRDVKKRWEWILILIWGAMQAFEGGTMLIILQSSLARGHRPSGARWW